MAIYGYESEDEHEETRASEATKDFRYGFRYFYVVF